MSKQPEALRLADALDSGEVYESCSLPVYGWVGDDPCADASAELRRLHALNAELLEALKGICDEQDERQGYASYEAYDKARAAIAKAEAA